MYRKKKVMTCEKRSLDEHIERERDDQLDEERSWFVRSANGLRCSSGTVSDSRSMNGMGFMLVDPSGDDCRSGAFHSASAISASKAVIIRMPANEIR